MNEAIISSEIISCSRRTDIPAFLMDWVMKCIDKGFVDVANPYNKKQISRISLKPNSTRVWVWWSKNYGSWIEQYQKNKNILGEYHHFFNFTINSPSSLENGLKVSLEDRFSQLKWLADTFGTESIQFRFDPIVFYKKVGIDQPIFNNLDKFDFIVTKIAEIGIKELIFSFASIYPKVEKRMQKRGKIIIDPSIEEKKDLIKKLNEISRSVGIEMFACCQPELDIKQAHCIDGNKISKITGENIKLVLDKGQRENCGCTKSRDIGGYAGFFKCRHNCDYCYANPSLS